MQDRKFERVKRKTLFEHTFRPAWGGSNEKFKSKSSLRYAECFDGSDGTDWLRFRQCGRNKNGNYCKWRVDYTRTGKFHAEISAGNHVQLLFQDVLDVRNADAVWDVRQGRRRWKDYRGNVQGAVSWYDRKRASDAAARRGIRNFPDRRGKTAGERGCTGIRR